MDGKTLNARSKVSTLKDNNTDLLIYSYSCLQVSRILCCSVALWLGCYTCDQQVAGSTPGRWMPGSYPGQVGHMHVPSDSEVTTLWRYRNLINLIPIKNNMSYCSM